MRNECRFDMDKEKDEWSLGYFNSCEFALGDKRTKYFRKKIIWYIRGLVRGGLRLTIAFVKMEVNTIDELDEKA